MDKMLKNALKIRETADVRASKGLLCQKKRAQL
jgi:hypothetical protein